MRKVLALSLSFNVFLIACATSPLFPYKFFHLSGNNFSGTLLGKEPKDDIPFDECRPTPGQDETGKPIMKQRCVVVQYPTLTALIEDYKKTKSDLITCQKGNQ